MCSLLQLMISLLDDENWNLINKWLVKVTYWMKLTASSRVSSSFRLLVSGSNIESKPAKIARIPNIHIGRTFPKSPLTSWLCKITKIKRTWNMYTFNNLAPPPLTFLQNWYPKQQLITNHTHKGLKLKKYHYYSPNPDLILHMITCYITIVWSCSFYWNKHRFSFSHT